MPKIPFEVASDIAEDATSHLISSRSQMLLLSQSGFLHFLDRWYHTDGADFTDAEKRTIEDWASFAEHELLAETAGSGNIPTPFWDTATDVDDEAVPAEQVWYGEVDDPELPPDELSFVENVGIWVFTGFLAVSGTPGAAILFNTLAPEFVLAMRGDDFGEVIRVLVDGQDQALVDTTDRAGEIIEVPIVADPDLSTHDVMLIKVS